MQESPFSNCTASAARPTRGMASGSARGRVQVLAAPPHARPRGGAQGGLAGLRPARPPVPPCGTLLGTRLQAQALLRSSTPSTITKIRSRHRDCSAPLAARHGSARGLACTSIPGALRRPWGAQIQAIQRPSPRGRVNAKHPMQESPFSNCTASAARPTRGMASGSAQAHQRDPTSQHAQHERKDQAVALLTAWHGWLLGTAQPQTKLAQQPDTRRRPAVGPPV